MNHVSRTFFFHVLHLFRAGVQPIFVFDGPGKPAEKGVRHPPDRTEGCEHVWGLERGLERGLDDPQRKRIVASSRRTKEDEACERKMSHVIPLCRGVLEYLGAEWRDAPAEAEAECAALEQAGVVDAVMTRDGDAFVFGARRMLRKLDAENKVANVREYKMEDLEAARPGLRRADMFLVAMTAGGDYDEGVSGCGVRIAVEAARQFFGSQLVALVMRDDAEGAKRWRESLVDGLRNNPKGKFSQKWVSVANAVARDRRFPSKTIARFYLQPLVSDDLTRPINWTKPTPIDLFREFTRQFFDWRHLHLSWKFINNLALPLLIRALLSHGARGTDGSILIQDITRHKDTDGFHELRVQFIPSHVVTMDISQERAVEGYRANLTRDFDPDAPTLEWIPQWVVEYGAPSAFQDWQEKGKGKGIKRKASDPLEPKRKRGRPPKAESSGSGVRAEPASFGVAETQNRGPETLAPKRGRGRPRKAESSSIGVGEGGKRDPGNSLPKPAAREQPSGVGPPNVGPPNVRPPTAVDWREKMGGIFGVETKAAPVFFEISDDSD
ncbi:PIN domain-like protein [Podospora aff. communis PSN243]|uniref:PIN domain-like protein n=1 Tax=Podospora aff. communis PSN243 TaxID=3040156 RepID=A0AAV9H094_9PEZI|nr:PIN domain-like protein [Podospora aff. communis PSN243]